MDIYAGSIPMILVWICVCYGVYKHKQKHRPISRFCGIPIPCRDAVYIPMHTVPINNTDRDPVGGCMLELQKDRNASHADTVTIESYL